MLQKNMRNIKRQFPHCWLLINWQPSQLKLKQSVCFMVMGKMSVLQISNKCIQIHLVSVIKKKVGHRYFNKIVFILEKGK